MIPFITPMQRDLRFATLLARGWSARSMDSTTTSNPSFRPEISPDAKSSLGRWAQPVGYRFEESPLKPRLGADFDVVSGDSGTGHFGTFNPLFFKSGYFDDASLIRPSNIIDIHPTLQLQAPHALLVTLGSDVIWRYTRRDGIYGPPGNLELPAGGQGRYLATTAEASVQWPPTTIMTGTTTQMMIDIADMIRGVHGAARDATRSRLRRMGTAVASFAVGAAAGALLFHAIGSWCFALPPVVAFLARITAKSSLTAPTSTPGPESAATSARR
jgi:hypothetical protein